MASAIPLSVSAKSKLYSQSDSKDLYELRTYEIRFGGNLEVLKNYLQNVLKPALFHSGANHFKLFSELGESEPSKLWVLICYPELESFIKCINLKDDQKYVTGASDYNNTTEDNKIYNRIESSLLYAFDRIPRFRDPGDAGLFELRTYEGYSEDAVSRKIDMFNNEEIALFDKVGLHPYFFGEMIIGPYRPCLTYMIDFKDMKERDANWEEFINHPDWKEMSSKPIYANTVSNIRKTFLLPV